jgi:ribosome-binding factor A
MRSNDRKLGQLCREAERTLSMALAAVDDPLISSVSIVGVEPAPDAAHLAIAVVTTSDPDAVIEKLRLIAGYLRAELAATISRKKPPMLWFQIVG